MKINNINIEIKKAITFRDRLIGLMGKKDINYGMLFPRCNCIHTYFMKEPIDVLALNKNNEIIFKITALKPNKIFNVKSSINETAILELPQNTSSSLKLGQKIIFK